MRSPPAGGGLLPEEDRTTLGSLLATSWYPFDIGKRLDHAIVDQIGGGQIEFVERLGEASAEKNLTTVYRNFRKSAGRGGRELPLPPHLGGLSRILI